MEDIKTIVQNRLAYVMGEIKHGESLAHDVVLGKFWSGKLAALNEEQRFLEKLLEDIR